MNDKKITDLTYPVRGLDLQTAFGVQRPGTTPCCQNCLGHEPCSGRRRGGRRPGLSRLNGQVPAGSTLIQHLNEVVIGSTAGLYDPDYPWHGPVIPFRTTDGPSWTWGGGTITTDWNGDPITGEDEETQDPVGNGRRKRKKGSGIQPNVNRLTYSPPAITNYRMFQATGQVNITQPGPFFNTNPSFAACMCVDTLYLTLAGPPLDARNYNGWWCQKVYYFNLHGIAQNAYTFTGSVITGNTVGPVATWGVRACNAGGNIDYPAQAGHSVLDNIDLSGDALCCTALTLVPREVSYPLAPGSAGLEPSQDSSGCRTEGDV